MGNCYETKRKLNPSPSPLVGSAAMADLHDALPCSERPDSSKAGPQSTRSGRSYAAAVFGSPANRPDLSNLTMVDVSVSVHQPEFKDGKLAIIFTLLELQRSEAPL